MSIKTFTFKNISGGPINVIRYGLPTITIEADETVTYDLDEFEKYCKPILSLVKSDKLEPQNDPGSPADVAMKVDKSPNDNQVYGLLNGGTTLLDRAQRIIYVDSNVSETGDGTLFRPYKTLSEVVAWKNLTTVIVYIAPGGYNETFDCTGYVDWSFIVEGDVAGQYRANLTGLNIGTGTKSVGFTGLSITNQVSLDSDQGNVYFTNVAMKAGFIHKRGTYYDFEGHCEIMGDVTIQAVGMIYVRDSTSEDTAVWTINNSAAILVADSVSGLTPHIVAGSFICMGSTNLSLSSKMSSTYALVAEEGALQIKLLSGSTLQADGSVAPIQVKGLATQYSLGGFIFTASTSQLNGVRALDGINSRQVMDANTRPGYTQTGGTVKDHLDGISAKLVEIEGRLS